MKSSLKCSVVIPTYNCLAYLKNALLTVQMQGIDGLEVIVIDDGSTDGTGAWLQNAAADFPFLHVITLGGAGPSRARNAALTVARGRFIAFLDADDLWWPGKLEKQLAYMEANPEVQFSFTDYLHFDPSGALRGTCFDYWKPPFADRQDTRYMEISDAEYEILAANTVGTSTVVCSQSALQNANGFPEHSRSAEDWDLWLRLARQGPVACSSEVTTSYLMRPTSVTQNRINRIASMRRTVRPYGDAPAAAARRAYRRATARIDVAEAEYLRQLDRPMNAALLHARALLLWPQWRTARACVADIAATLRPAITK